MIEVGCASQIGRIRAKNDDRYFADAGTGLFIVSDGAGGYEGGGIASAFAIEIIASYLGSPKAKLDITNARSSEEFKEVVNQLIEDAIKRANAEIYEFRQIRKEYKGMASTVVLAWFVGSYVHLASVGDSRAYLIRDGRLKQLTEDNSLVTQLVRQRNITPEQARKHPLRHVVTKILGSRRKTAVPVSSIHWTKGDYFVLCSDGLIDRVTDEEIRKITLTTGCLQETCRRLIQLASKRDGTDDITVMAIHTK
jgi:serine/threonine protein phosphatase PrpC